MFTSPIIKCLSHPKNNITNNHVYITHLRIRDNKHSLPQKPNHFLPRSSSFLKSVYSPPGPLWKF